MEEKRCGTWRHIQWLQWLVSRTDHYLVDYACLMATRHPGKGYTNELVYICPALDVCEHWEERKAVFDE